VELFLNILWFAMAAGALAAFLRKHRRGRKDRRLLLALGALLCAAALLFPAISVTDDLHRDAFVVEDSSAAKRLANAVAHTAPLAAIEWFGICSLAFLLGSQERRWRMVEIGSITYNPPPLSSTIFGRAPPATLPV
jgi:peptidoglycan/LPS O-acetylase OafA/YrhL